MDESVLHAYIGGWVGVSANIPHTLIHSHNNIGLNKKIVFIASCSLFYVLPFRSEFFSPSLMLCFHIHSIYLIFLVIHRFLSFSLP